ncbi:hypothetical protein [Antarcticirhabdus aurantiaca]|uniref:Uncharacterized protein n=1 Tax=Antarcticirhabdus aurantiaca TaxID=2606717 RepID=A0ACD4NK29_9HYPH|nr:hypothetical protein [Antarcticirhabdus aurantiaca]WAJ27111.1 hypothetical protein OXU80_19975 [Jeongeuplla avenae]
MGLTVPQIKLLANTIEDDFEVSVRSRPACALVRRGYAIWSITYQGMGFLQSTEKGKAEMARLARAKRRGAR